MRSRFLTILCVLSSLPACAEPLQRLQYNNPGLVVDLGVGLWAWPLPMDFDGDGDLDLVVSCPDKPYNGTYVFENASAKGTKMPVFKPGKRISKGMTNARISYVNGKPIVTTPGATYPDFKNTGFDKPGKIGVSANVHPNKVRANEWHFADLDGDGVQDLVIGIEDWTNYGWDNAYDENGHWTNELLRGEVYFLKGLDQGFDKPKHLAAGGVQLNGFGMPSPCIADFDGDGDLDMICGEFIDGFTFYKNASAKQKVRQAAGLPESKNATQRVVPPLRFDKGIRLKHDGKFIHMDLEMITPTPIDWDGDGDIDLICGDEDGRVALIENTGKFVDGAPDFLPPVYFQQEAEDVKVGALCSPAGVDWDGDGDDDIVTGSSAGYITFVENLSGPKVASPKWAAAKRLEANGKVIRLMAGPNGSIQGPAECKWGYTTVNVADWDGDGLPDIMCNSIWGKVHWYKNVGTRTAPKLAAAQPIEVEWNGRQPELAWGWMKPEGKALLTQWRTTPVIVDFDGDGKLDLVMLDHEGYLAFFKRSADGKLAAPQRVLADETGKLLQMNTGFAGKSGRRKLTIFDWNGDGKLDILINSQNAELWQQVGQRDGKWLFKNMGNLSDTNLAGHDTSPTTTDFDGDGVRDLLLGAEDGRFYTLKNPRSK